MRNSRLEQAFGFRLSAISFQLSALSFQLMDSLSALFAGG
jgi:hypothetical protein